MTHSNPDSPFPTGSASRRAERRVRDGSVPATPHLRLFFAVWLPDPVRAALAILRPPAHTEASAAYRWVDPPLLHVTLAFLGSQPASMLEDLGRAGAAVGAASRPARLALGDAGTFGPARAPRVLWVGLAGDVAALRALQAQLASALQRVGVRLEDRAFSPHITLARRRANAPSAGPPAWPPSRPVPRLEIPLDEFVLVRSDLSASGARYSVLKTFPVSGAYGER